MNADSARSCARLRIRARSGLIEMGLMRRRLVFVQMRSAFRMRRARHSGCRAWTRSAPVPRPGSKAIVLIALFGNFGIAISKFVAALLSGSAAMASEGVHSLADTANEILLLYGMS